MRTLFARAITAGATIKGLLTLFANMLRGQRIFSIILIARCRARSAFDSPSRDDQPRLVPPPAGALLLQTRKATAFERRALRRPRKGASLPKSRMSAPGPISVRSPESGPHCVVSLVR